MENQKLKKYLIRTFLISWVSWLALAALVKSGVMTFSDPIGRVLFIIGGFGPTIAAISLLENKSFKAVSSFIFSHKKKSVWYLLLFCLLQALTKGLSSGELNPDVPLFALPIVFLVCTFVGGGNEELGWRGMMQPILEKKLAFPIATLITGAVWSVWHLPLWFVDGSPQISVPFVLFAINAICLSFLLACVYKRTGSVFCCASLHGFCNMLESVFVMKVNWILVLGMIITVAAAVVLWYKKDKTVSE